MWKNQLAKNWPKNQFGPPHWPKNAHFGAESDDVLLHMDEKLDGSGWIFFLLFRCSIYFSRTSLVGWSLFRFLPDQWATLVWGGRLLVIFFPESIIAFFAFRYSIIIFLLTRCESSHGIQICEMCSASCPGWILFGVLISLGLFNFVSMFSNFKSTQLSLCSYFFPLLL